MKEHENKHTKVDNTILGITAIVSIFIIVLIVINSNSSPQAYTNDNVGNAAVMFKDSSMCNIIIGQTMSYDDNVMAVSLGTDESTQYTGYVVSVESIDDNGCTINIGGDEEYLALGQIQRVGSLYVTIKDIVR